MALESNKKELDRQDTEMRLHTERGLLDTEGPD